MFAAIDFMLIFLNIVVALFELLLLLAIFPQLRPSLIRLLALVFVSQSSPIQVSPF